MTAWSLTEAQKLVDVAQAERDAARDALRPLRDRIAQLEQHVENARAAHDRVQSERDLAYEVLADHRAALRNEETNLARVNAQLDAERATTDRLAADLNARRIELGQLRDELTRERLEKIQLEAQRKAVGSFLLDAIREAS